MERRIDVRQLTALLTLFMIAQFTGLLLVYVSFPAASLSQLAAQSQQQPQLAASSYLLIFAAEIVVIILVLMFVVRSSKGKNFFALAEAYIILLGSFFFFLIILSDLFPYLSSVELEVASGLCAIAIYLLKRRKSLNTQTFRNIITILSSIGVGIFIGVSIGSQFGVLVLYAILGIFAIYDYLAVFVLKFMIPMAKHAASMNLAFMIGSSELELHPKTNMKKAQYTAADIKSIKNPSIRKLIKAGNMPAVSSVMLGNGDIMLPLLVSSGAYVFTGSISLALAITVGAIFGLIATFWIIRRYMIGLPAIPPIFAFVSISLAVFYLASGVQDLIIWVYILSAVVSIAAMYFAVRRAGSTTGPTSAK
jgi:presenilin-like A22 family membrane protease